MKLVLLCNHRGTPEGQWRLGSPALSLGLALALRKKAPASLPWVTGLWKCQRGRLGEAAQAGVNGAGANMALESPACQWTGCHGLARAREK